MDHPRIHWLSDPTVLAPLAVLALAWVLRFRRARAEAGPRAAGSAQAAAFAGAFFALLLALASPLDGLGEEYLFSAHMLQHLLLGDIAPALLLLSLSRVMMRPLTRRLSELERRAGWVFHPVSALAIWLGTMYLWHVPALYDAALEQPLVHALEHVTFFCAGVAVWWPLIQPVPMRHGLRGLWVVPYLGAAKAGLGLLGVALIWSDTVFYRYYEQVPRIWSLSALEDQNVGGAIMMLEQSVVFVLALVVLFLRALARVEREQETRERLELAGRSEFSAKRRPA